MAKIICLVCRFVFWYIHRKHKIQNAQGHIGNLVKGIFAYRHFSCEKTHVYQ